MKQCPEEEVLGAYLDGELPDDQRAAVENHVKDCGDCAASLDELRRLEELVRGAPLPPVAEAEWAATWGKVAARLEPFRPRLLPRLRWVLAPLAAAALLAAAIGVWQMAARTSAPAPRAIVEVIEPAEGYTSNFFYSSEGDVTIISVIPATAEGSSSGNVHSGGSL